MNIIRTSRNVAIIALLLSLLFHGTSIFYIFSQKTRNSLAHMLNQHKQNAPVIPKPEKQKNNTEWIETRARAGNFGAPVFFEETFEPEQVAEQEKIEIEQEYPQAELKQEKQEPQSQLPETAHQSIEKSIVSTTTTIQPPTKAQTQKADNNQQKKAPRQKKQPKQTIFTQSPPKPPLTLAQLTQGFLHQRKKDAGTHGISMIGKKGIPTDEQMKYERYLQKLNWCIQNCFKIHERKHPIPAQNTTVDVFFALNRDGTPQQLFLKNSSGNMHVDQFVLFIFRDASSSFPPLPNYLPDNPLKCIYRYDIIVNPPY